MKKLIWVFFGIIVLVGCDNSLQDDMNANTTAMIEEDTSSQDSSTETTEITESTTEQISEELVDTEIENAEKQPDEQEQTMPQENTDNENYYAVCTNYSKSEVENFALSIKNLILNKNWEQLADNIDYPISVGDVTYNNREEFISGNVGEHLNNAFFTEIENESCVDMFSNYMGIMMGSGEVWIAESMRSATEKGELKVIAINP